MLCFFLCLGVIPRRRACNAEQASYLQICVIARRSASQRAQSPPSCKVGIVIRSPWSRPASAASPRSSAATHALRCEVTLQRVAEAQHIRFRGAIHAVEQFYCDANHRRDLITAGAVDSRTRRRLIAGANVPTLRPLTNLGCSRPMSDGTFHRPSAG